MPYWGVYLDYLGFTGKEIGQLMAIFLGTKMVAPNIWAWVADWLVARHGSAMGMVKVATFLTVLVYLLLYVFDDFWPVALIMLGYCVFWNATLPQLEAATLNHIDNKNQYGKIRLWGSLGFIATVTLVGVVMDSIGPKAILSAGAISLALLFFASLLMPSSQRSVDRVSQADSRKGIGAALNHKIILLLFLCFLMQLSHAPLQTFMSLYFEEYGYTNWQIGLLWTTGVVCEIVVFIFAYKLLARFSLSSMLTFTFGVAAARWLLVGAFPEKTSIVILTQASHAITFGLYHAVMMQVVNRFFVGSYQNRGQALYSSVTFGLGGAVGSFLSGYIWSDVGKQELFILVGLLMLLVSGLSALFTRYLVGEDSQ